MSPFRFPTGGGFQTTRMAVEDSAKALTKSGAAPGSLIKGAIFKGIQCGYVRKIIRDKKIKKCFFVVQDFD